MAGHSHTGNDIGKLRTALLVTSFILVLETVGGVVSHSLALLTDASHMLTDVGAAALGLWAAAISTRQRDDTRSFGYGRAPVLAALANACALFLIVAFLAVEALRRLHEPQPVQSTLMVWVAAAALLANLALTWFLTRGEHDSLNVRAVIAHVVGDAFISAAVIVAGILILFTTKTIIDPIVSLIAAIAVSFSAWSLVRDSLNILMEGTPAGLNIPAVEQFVRQHAPVEDVHDLHIWCLSDRSFAASLHVRVERDDLDQGPSTVAVVKKILLDRFHIAHCTVEVECENCEAAC